MLSKLSIMASTNQRIFYTDDYFNAGVHGSFSFHNHNFKGKLNMYARAQPDKFFFFIIFLVFLCSKMFKNVSPDLVRSGRTCPANLGVRSCPVRKLICPVRSSPNEWRLLSEVFHRMGWKFHDV